MNDKDFFKLLKKRKDAYNTTKNIYCPFLKEVVYFNNKGIFHATHSGDKTFRPRADAVRRLNLLPHIYDCIKYATGFENEPRITPKNGPNNRYGAEIIEYELMHSVNKKFKAVVILKRIGNGRLYYWSVYDKQNK
jgi:hypothetical protein